jgi:hypothetical protein
MSTAAGSAGSAVYGKTLDGGEIEFPGEQHPTGRDGHLACVAVAWWRTSSRTALARAADQIPMRSAHPAPSAVCENIHTHLVPILTTDHTRAIDCVHASCAHHWMVSATRPTPLS